MPLLLEPDFNLGFSNCGSHTALGITASQIACGLSILSILSAVSNLASAISGVAPRCKHKCKTSAYPFDAN